MFWGSFRCCRETFTGCIIARHRRGRNVTFMALYSGHALPRCELRDPTIDAVCSDLLCREIVAWLGLFSVLTGDAELWGLTFGVALA